MQYLVTFQPQTGRPSETVEADRHTLETGGASMVFRSVRRVAFTEREVVVLRLDAATVLTVTPA